MNEKSKLGEARYFLGRMRTKPMGLTNFRYELSAFLGAARSVLQYALEEAKTKTGGQTWYDGAIASEPLFKFFKDKRDINIHQTPVATKRQFSSYRSSFLQVDEDTIIPYEHEAVREEYFFDDWTGDEEVATLCQRYVDAIEALVNDGIAKSMIRG